MKYRWHIFVISLLGMTAAWFLPHLLLAIHEVSGMSTAHEFHTYRLIDKDRLEEVRVEFNEPNYSIEQRIRAVGALQTYIPMLSVLLAAPFALIAVLAWLSTSSASGTPERYETARDEPTLQR